MPATIESLAELFQPLDGRKASVRSARTRAEQARLTPSALLAALEAAGEERLTAENAEAVVSLALERTVGEDGEVGAAAESLTGPMHDRPVTPDPGVYEVFIDCPPAVCPANQIEIPDVFRGFDAASGRERSFVLQVTRTVNVQVVKCADQACGHTWEVPPPLRPSGLMRSVADEEEYLAAFTRGWLCAECAKKGKTRPGYEYRPEGPSGLIARKTRPRWFFTSAEMQRLLDKLAIEKAEARIEEVKQADGSVRRQRTGWVKRPLEYRWRARTSDGIGAGGKKSIRVNKIIRVSGPFALDVFGSVPQELLTSQIARQSQIGRLQHELAEVQARLCEVTDRDEMRGLLATAKRLTAQVTKLMQQAR